MKRRLKGQVQLNKLIFTVNWEDPISDYQALKINPGDRMMTITSGGCNTISFLLYNPSEIYALDINPSQSYLLELKIAAIRKLPYDAFIAFLGLTKAENRNYTYQQIRPGLSHEAAVFWDQNIKMITKGFMLNGRYEKFVKLVGKIMLLVQGRKRITNLFKEKTPAEQQIFFQKKWNSRRTRFMFDLFFNKHILAKRGLKADYFHFDDGSDSFSSSFFNRFKKALSDIPVKDNYFLHLYLRGRYRSLNEVPEYLLEKNYAVIKSRLDRIKIVTNDAKHWLASMPDSFINCFALSNICELMDYDDTLKFFNEVYRTAYPEARICFRNLMIPREVPEEIHNRIIKDDLLSISIFNNDRSFVYGKVAAYFVKK